MADSKEPIQSLADIAARRISRRNFIRGVIGSGVAVSSATYLFRASGVFGQGGDRLLTLNVNGQPRRVRCSSA